MHVENYQLCMHHATLHLRGVHASSLPFACLPFLLLACIPVMCPSRVPATRRAVQMRCHWPPPTESYARVLRSTEQKHKQDLLGMHRGVC